MLAAAGLVDRLSRVFDSASARWWSEPIGAVLADIQAFIDWGDDQA